MTAGSSKLSNQEPGSPQLLCILGVPRTGTNHLCSVLSSIPEVEVRFEIFHPVRSYLMHPNELVELARMTGKDFEPSSDNPDAVNTLRSNPELALQCILRFMEPSKRLLAFKVFAHHLSVNDVENAILARSDVAIVFVRRRPIDTYISHMKAAAVGKWSQVDTTDLKIKIDATDFVNWWQQAADWYRYLEAACWTHGRHVSHLSYETDINIPPVRLARRLTELLASNGIHNLTMPDESRLGGISRQDRTSDVEQRVSNWPDFYNELTAMGAVEKAFAAIPQFKPG